MSRRTKLVLLSLGGLLVVAVLGAAVSVYLLLQPDRFTAMLQAQARAVGLELNLASPASPTLFPRPALDLKGITLNAEGATVPILLAARGRLALPWRTLLGGPTVISQLQIDSPRVDLDALQEWIAALPAQRAGAAPNIPRINTGISISHGSVVRGNEVLLDNVALQAGSLISGEPFPLTLSADTSTGTALQLRLSATPRIQGNTLQLDDVSLHLAQGGNMTVTLTGNARWHGAADAAATLAGQLDGANTGQYDIALTLTPAGQDNPLLLALKLDGPDNHADLRLPPLALVSWWNLLNDPQSPRISLPPGSGHAEIARIDSGSISIQGLTVSADDRVPPSATSASSAAPAASASVDASP